MDCCGGDETDRDGERDDEVMSIGYLRRQCGNRARGMCVGVRRRRYCSQIDDNHRASKYVVIAGVVQVFLSIRLCHAVYGEV